jgi:AraC family transcriptional regulator
VLPPSANGYRRSLFPGRGVSVYYDRHPANEWSEHIHEQVQGAVLLGKIKVQVRWQTPDGIWHQLAVEGPAIWLIPAGMPHALACPDDADMVTLFIERSFVVATLAREVAEFTAAPLAHLASRDQVIGQLAKTFRGLCNQRGSAHPLYVEGIGTTLGTHVLQLMFGPAGHFAKRGGLTPDALQQVMRHIDDHLGERILLDNLARVAGMCRSRFTKLFKRSVSLTAHNYVMHRRVEYAQELLETTDGKELEIAHLCGFSDDTLMARWFRKVLDCTPREIRANRPQ